MLHKHSQRFQFSRRHIPGLLQMSNQCLDLITKRRTIYAIAKNIEQSPERLTDLIQTAIKQSPSAFNSQSSRAVILFNTEHEKFWGIVADKLKSYAKDEASA